MPAGSASLARRVGTAVAATVVVAAAAGAIAAWIRPAPLVVFASALGGGALAALLLVGRVLAPVSEALRALVDGVRSFRDSDFSLRLASPRRDEIGELLALYNEMGETLRRERHELYQRELLLDTVLQGAPVAVLLSGPTGRVLFANRAARELLAGGRRLDGRRLEEALDGAGPELRAALIARTDGLVSVAAGEGEEETFRTAHRAFQINGQPHALRLVERLTPELRRREVEVWKKAIRVMNHELNNSLAPIRSMVHSARTVLGRPEHAHRLEEIFDIVDERVGHLARFLDDYARFARLPSPRPEPVSWPAFVDGLRPLATFRVEGALPERPGTFDPGQMQQALINLLKNAHESGSPEGEIALAVAVAADGATLVQVLDRGRGMDAETLGRALLPFYSSKPAGTGLGLPLCKEIVEAHGGRLHVQNRPGGGLAVTCWLPPR